MKVLKKIALVLLNFVLFSLVFMLIFSFSLKNFFSEAFLSGIVREKLSSELTSDLDDDSKIKEVLESEEANKFINDYINKTLDGVVDNSSLNDINISDDLLAFIRENKSELEKEIGVSIPMDKVEELLQSDSYKELENSYKNTVKEVSNSVPESQKKLIKLYNFLLSIKFKVIVSILIIIILVLMALLEKSLYKWLKYLGSATILSGIFIGIMIIIARIGVDYITENTSYNINFKIDHMIVCGVVTFIIGIVIYIIYKIIDNISRKKEVKEVVS